MKQSGMHGYWLILLAWVAAYPFNLLWAEAESPQCISGQYILNAKSIGNKQAKAIETLEVAAQEDLVPKDSNEHIIVVKEEESVEDPVRHVPERLGNIACRKLDRLARSDLDKSRLSLSKRYAAISQRQVARGCECDGVIKLEAVPDDSSFSNLWGMNQPMNNDINALEAWDIHTGTHGAGAPIVAVIDTGVDYNHPDLAANMWINPNEIAGNGIDDDGNGYVDDVRGYDFHNNDSNPMDDNSHGTHCAGTIGGVGNNARGVTGVAWRTNIMALKFLNSSGSGSYSDAVRAFDYVTNLRNRGVDVRLSSNSWGGTGYSSSLYYAVNRAASAGHLIVAAAGNSNVNTDSSPHYPSSFTQNNVISVASMQSNGARSSFSNWGKTSVDIFAPGSGILSTLPSNSYAYYSGTSMATPHVSGAIILLASYAPHLGWEALRQAVLTTASYRSAYNNLVSTNGILNVRAMLESVGPTPTPGPSPTPTLTPTVTPTPIPTNTPTPTPTNTPTVTPTPAFYDVSGQVKDSNGTGMAGVRVDITVESGSFTQFTDAAGRYELNSLPGGGLRTIQVNLTASGRTFAPYSTLLNQNLEILHLAHPANYQLNGRVIRLQDALPIPNARVDGGTLGTVYTDNNGDFSFPVSWGQSYSLSVSHDEYIFDNRSVTGIIRGNTSRRFAGKH